MTKTGEKLLFSYFFAAFSLLSGRPRKSLFRCFFVTLNFFGVSGSVGPFAPHKAGERLGMQKSHVHLSGNVERCIILLFLFLEFISPNITFQIHHFFAGLFISRTLHYTFFVCDSGNYMENVSWNDFRGRSHFSYIK